MQPSQDSPETVSPSTKTSEMATTPEVTSEKSPKPKKSFRPKGKLGLAVIIAMVLVVVLGGSAGAYFGIIVPNKPENVLKASVENFTKQEVFTAKGKVDISSGGTAMTADMNTVHIDATKKVMLMDMNLTVSGVKLPVEVRYVDDNAYVKLGDLTTLKSLLSGYGGAEMAPLVDKVSSSVSNQWVEIDKTLLSSASSSEATAKCTPDEVAVRTRAAINEAISAGVDDSNKVYTIQKTSTETVDGVKTKKLEIGLDTQKLAAFSTRLKDLPAAKELEKCADTSMKSETDALAKETAELKALNVWVDGSKHIKRVELKLSSTVDNTATTMGLDMTMLKTVPTVEKPANAKPFMQLVGELGQLYQDATGVDPTALSDSLSL